MADIANEPQDKCNAEKNAWSPAISERRYVLFDFDGTLADTMPSITSTAVEVLREWGMTDDEIGDTKRLVGPPFPAAFSMVYGVSEDDAAEITRRSRAIYNVQGPETFPLFDGMGELLDTLRANGRHLAVATSKTASQAERMVRELGIWDKFDAVVGKVRDGRGAKATIIGDALERLGCTADDAVMVGDRFYDVEGAAQLGMPCVGVLFGTATEAELADAGAAAIARTADEVADALLGNQTRADG